MLQQITCMTIRLPSSPMTPERYISLPFSWGGVGGYPDCSSSLHARFFPMTPERYISLPFRLFFFGGVFAVSCLFHIITSQILPHDPWKIHIINIWLGGVGGASAVSSPGKRWRLTVYILYYIYIYIKLHT